MSIKINRTGDWIKGLPANRKHRAVTNAVIRKGREQMILDRDTLKQLIEALAPDLEYYNGEISLMEAEPE